MGLLGALNTAVSGLNVNQKQLNTLSQNISNANTANYTNEVVNQQADFIDGNAEGASIASITREVNQFLTAEVQTQTSANSAATTLTNYYSDIQNFLGQPGGTSSVDQQINSFFTAMQNMANTPSAATETNVVDTATTLSGSVSSLASSLEGLRLQSDTDISSAVGSVNTDLQTLFQTNSAIEHAAATGQNTDGLLDTRDSTLTDLAKYIDISPSYSGDGEVALATTSGTTLLTSTTYGQLNFTPAGSAQTFVQNGNMSPITVTAIDANGNSQGVPTTLTTGGPSAGVTTTLTSGKIQTLLSLRDSVIPNILGQLDQLANSVTNQVNAISNTGTSFPPPNSYTGTTLVTGNSTSAYSGSIMIAALNSSGTATASPYTDETHGIQPLTLNLGSLNYGQGPGVLSTNNIINAINQYYGTPQNKVELGNLNNAQLQVASNTVPAITQGTNTLNFDFNLNNISSSNANFYVGGVTVLDSNGNIVASSAPSGSQGAVTTTQPSVNVASITTYGNSNVTVNTTGTSTIGVGDNVYLNLPSTPSTINGVASSQLSGYFTVTGVTNSGFTISVPAAASSTPGTANVSGASALTQYATVGAGTTSSTANNGIISANIASNLSSPYYTVQANIGTINSSGQLVTSVVTYQVPNNTINSMNNVIGATSASGSGTIVAPTTNQPILTAELVDANGNPLPETAGSYGNEQGYLKIVANNSGNSVAINQMDSQQLGYNNSSFGTVSTGQGLSQYFGLNNFFVPNTQLSPTNLVQNSAINMAVNSNIVNNPSLITAGQLTQSPQPTSSSGSGSGSVSLPNYTYVVTSGDNSVSQALAGLATQDITFSSSGGLPQSSTTFSQYAGDIIAATSTNATSATNAQTNTQALLSGFTQSAQSVSGVNLDQELANTVIYQNAYSASARIISVVDQMFSELINSIGTS